MSMTFDSRVSEFAAGYLEFIWPVNGKQSPEGSEPQAIATVADLDRKNRPFESARYVGNFRHHLVYGRNVSECKQALFSVIDAEMA